MIPSLGGVQRKSVMFTSENAIYEIRGPFGVPIQIAPSSLLLVLIFVEFGAGSTAMFYDLAVLAVIISSILLHEIGHAWGALVQGVPVHRIVLNGCGGFCQPGRSATRRENELIVAMGPIVNLTLWAVFSLIAPLLVNETMWWLAITIAQVNLWLALFNLLPITPLDGSKLLYLVLSRVFPSDTAVRIGGGIGLFVAAILLMAVAGLVAVDPWAAFDWWLLLVLLILVPAVPVHWRMVAGQTG